MEKVVRFQPDGPQGPKLAIFTDTPEQAERLRQSFVALLKTALSPIQALQQAAKESGVKVVDASSL